MLYLKCGGLRIFRRHRAFITIYGAVKASTGILKHGKRVVRAKSL